MARPMLIRSVGLGLAIVTWYAGAIYAQQLSYWRESAGTRLRAYGDLVEVASGMIALMEDGSTSPGGSGSENGNFQRKDDLSTLTRRFETLYWGRVALAGAPGLSACLKDLRSALLDSGRGFDAGALGDRVHATA